MKKIMLFIKRLFINIINIFPTNKKLLLFESVDLGDNSKALFDRMNERNIVEKYHIIWVVRDAKQHRQLYPEIKFVSRDNVSYRLFYRIFAACCFSSHYFAGMGFRRGQVRCYLTHGLSFKDTSKFYRRMDYYTDIICTSEFALQLRRKTFHGGEESMRILGYPRTDLLFQSTDAKNRMGISGVSKLIIWMPTFKHHIDGIRNDGKDDANDVLAFLKEEELGCINEHLQEKDAFLMIKFHPNQDMRFVKELSYSNIGTYVNQDLREKGVDVYEILAESDGLITDFSSVYTDYLLCDKPIGFDISGMDNYKLGFSVDDPMTYMPGIKISAKKDLLDFIDIVSNGGDPFYEKRIRLKNLMHQYTDGKSADRIIEYFHL